MQYITMSYTIAVYTCIELGRQICKKNKAMFPCLSENMNNNSK